MRICDAGRGGLRPPGPSSSRIGSPGARRAPLRRRGRQSERGYTLAALLVIVTILAMVLAYTIPEQWSRVIKREREIHTIWVMKQYARGIQEFQKKRGTYPVSLEQLTEQKNPRIIRQLYPNPLTGELDWVLVPFGTRSPAHERRHGGPGGPLSAQTPTTPQTTPATGPGGKQVGPFIGVRLADDRREHRPAQWPDQVRGVGLHDQRAPARFGGGLSRRPAPA